MHVLAQILDREAPLFRAATGVLNDVDLEYRRHHARMAVDRVPRRTHRFGRQVQGLGDPPIGLALQCTLHDTLFGRRQARVAARQSGRCVLP